MKRTAQVSALTLLLEVMTSFAAGGGGLRDFLSGVGTNTQWSRDISAPVVIEPSTSSAGSGLDLGRVRTRAQVEVAGVRLGMTREEVLKVWGTPSKAGKGFQFGTDRPNVRLSYSGSEDLTRTSPVSHVIFDAKTNAVVAMWLDCPGWYEKDSLAPKAEDCLRALGEPTLRNYIPEPLEPPKRPPKHWYCRMVYRDLAMVLYFGDGRLIALEVNPKAKGVAPEGQGSDQYSIPFCLE